MEKMPVIQGLIFEFIDTFPSLCWLCAYKNEYTCISCSFAGEVEGVGGEECVGECEVEADGGGSAGGRE